MARNIKYQFKNAIDDNFKGGKDKHSMKREGKMDNTRIFSYSDRNNLIDVSANFSNWMKKNHNEIKLVKDIKAKHIQKFLNEKAKTTSQATVNQYASKFNKLQNIINKTYGTKADYKGFIVPTTIRDKKVRNSSLSKEDFKKLEDSFSNSKSSAKHAIQLTARSGLRVAETVKLKGKDIDLVKNTIHVHEGKGKRSRDVPIRPEDRAYFNDLKASVGSNERICPVRSGSINAAVRRHMRHLGISDKYKDTNIHAIRKMYAQHSYNKLRGDGLGRREALGKVSILLGHGEDRIALMKEYVLEI